MEIVGKANRRQERWAPREYLPSSGDTDAQHRPYKSDNGQQYKSAFLHVLLVLSLLDQRGDYYCGGNQQAILELVAQFHEPEDADRQQEDNNNSEEYLHCNSLPPRS